VIVTLLLVVATLAERQAWMAGLAGGFAVAVRSDALLWLGLTVIFAMESQASRARVIAGALPGLALMLISNYARSGNPIDSGYEIAFSTPLLTGLYGLLFSAGKSVVLFSPLLLLYPAAVAAGWRDGRDRWLLNWSLALIIGQGLFFGKWWDWSGDDAWGPRLVILAMMAALIVIAASRWAGTRWFVGLTALGALLQLPPLLMGPLTSIMIDHTREVTKSAGWSERRAPITLDDVLFDPAYSQVTNTIELLCFELAPETPWLRRTSWLAGMTPPLERRQIDLDIFWLNPRRRGTR
jgi:hypothetical protein